ncbi:MAG: 1-acyl-sn-glycerol-3-phosphate acyltransferase [Nitrospinae bacterium]|nr:1-acyl-sn-glycerol-3-phosphate acyltransferase [Nitrospinota bacterium]
MIAGTGLLSERVMIRLGRGFVGLLVRLFTKMKITGMENIPPGGNILFLSNHISALDVLVIPWAIYLKYPEELLRQAGKEELFDIPVVGWILSKWRGFPIKRGGADRKSIRMIEEYIKEGKVILYPEGTRSRDGRLMRGNRMVGRIVRNTTPTVVPVSIKGTDRVIPVGKTIPRPGTRVELRFGAPMDLSDEYAITNTKESSQKIIDRVMTAIGELQNGRIPEILEKKGVPGE